MSALALRRGPTTGEGWPPATALVTGATSGIGQAITRRLLAAGTKVRATGRSAAALDQLASAGCATLSADLADPASWRQVAGFAGDDLDLLVAAAGIGAAGPVSELSTGEITEMLTVNLIAPLALVRETLPALRRGRGRIVLVGSVAGALAVRDEAVYSATKAGLAAFASALRSELSGAGVSVTLSVPGAVATPFFSRRGREYSRRFPRPLDPDRVAAAVLDAAAHRRREVWTPRWLAGVARLRGAAPTTYTRLADTFGGTS
jgi:short-subunit dehydrogenase